MAPDDTREDDEDPAGGRAQARAGRVAEARSVLAAIDRSVFPKTGRPTRAEQRLRAARAVAGLFEHG